MKFKQINEARYAAQRTISNLLTFFEELDHDVADHRAFALRGGFVCYYAGHDVEEIEDRNGTFYIATNTKRSHRLTEENITSVYVFKLDRVF